MKIVSKGNKYDDYENYVYTSNSLDTTLDTVHILEDYTSEFNEILRNPYGNNNKLREMSLLMYNANGMYTQQINYLSELYTYDYLIYPNYKNEIDDETKEDIKTNYKNTAYFLDKMDIKQTFPTIKRDILVEGTVFLYEVETKVKFNLRKIPFEFCKISYIENGINRYSVNLSMINETNISIFPTEIQKAYREYLIGDRKESWYLVGSRGVAFATDLGNSHGLPYFVFLLDSLRRQEKAKEKSDVKDNVDNTKLIHQKIPVDPRTNKPLFSTAVAGKFHEATKSNLPDGVAITTNPLDLSAVSFDKAYAQENDIVDRATKEVWNNSGLSNQLFNNTNNSAEALRKNVIVNQILLKRFMGYFTIYINSKISRRWKFSIKFMPTTEMNRIDMMKQYTSTLSVGGSRLQALAVFGLEPIEALNLLELEQNVLDIDTLMKPKDTSYNQSGEVGRPTNTDKGIDDSESAEDSHNRGAF